jgi:tetratricopeptide (TPR) repeat protein
MPFHDRYGLELTTSSDAAARAYAQGLDLQLAAWPGAAEAFDRAIAADPDFALAHIARGRVHFTYAEAAAAKACVTAAQAAVERNGTEREKSHVAALALGMSGQPAQSLTQALAHLERWPRDAMILSLPLGAFGLYAFSGMADHDQARVDLCEKHAHHYGDDWWFLTYLGWSYTENGNVALGRRVTEQAFGLKRENANAAHALAHAMFEDGSVADAERFIDGWLPSYDRSGLLNGHIGWHQALLALEREDCARALTIYADRIAPDVTTAAPLNAVTDCASLLWRVRMAGGDVPPAAWRALEMQAVQQFPKAGVTFADVHLALISAATGDSAALSARVAALEKRLADGKLAAGAVVPAACRAAQAFAAGDHAGCVALLEPVTQDIVRIGGSHAQREMIEDMQLLALMKSGASGKARSLLDARLHRRPSLRDARWRADCIAQ